MRFRAEILEHGSLAVEGGPIGSLANRETGAGWAGDVVSSLGGLQPEGLVDEQHLRGHIPLRQPPHLLLPDHVHDLLTPDGSPGPIEGPEALLGVHPPFHGPVVLLHQMVQVRTGATAAPGPQPALPLPLPYHLRI